MRRYGLAVGIVSMVLAVGSLAPPASATPPSPPELHYKDHNRVVQTLQNALGVEPLSGYFGQRTLAAVRAFQKRMGIPVTGVADAATWNALGRRVSRNAERHAAAMAADPGKKPAKGDSERRVCPVRNPEWSDGFGADRGDHSHQGVDIVGPRGVKIYAVDNGVITGAEWQSNGALAVSVVGSRGMWFYGHFDRIVVKHGQRLKAGDLIGFMGDSGSSGAVHLHLEYHPDGDFPNPAIDPEPLLRTLCK